MFWASLNTDLGKQVSRLWLGGKLMSPLPGDKEDLSYCFQVITYLEWPMFLLTVDLIENYYGEKYRFPIKAYLDMIQRKFPFLLLAFAE